MLFFLRMAFWITLICLLLPSSGDDHRLISSAEQTVNDVRGFCKRNPQVCEDARLTMTALLTKLRSGAETVQTWLTKSEKDGEDQPVAPLTRRGRFDQPPPQPVTKWQDSLNSTDKQVPWRGPGF
jgi:hypothetical protein